MRRTRDILRSDIFRILCVAGLHRWTQPRRNWSGAKQRRCKTCKRHEVYYTDTGKWEAVAPVKRVRRKPKAFENAPSVELSNVVEHSEGGL